MSKHIFFKTWKNVNMKVMILEGNERYMERLGMKADWLINGQ